MTIRQQQQPLLIFQKISERIISLALSFSFVPTTFNRELQGYIFVEVDAGGIVVIVVVGFQEHVRAFHI